MKIYINGTFCEKEDAKVSVFDHGLLYGDGAFEGIRAYNRLVFRLKEHIDRLYESAHTLMISLPMSRPQMMQAVVDTLKANNLENSYIRLIITRGEGDLGLDPRKCCAVPTVIIIADTIKLYPEELYRDGLKIVTVPTVRNHPEALNPQIKSLNYLNNIMAKMEAVNSGCDEAIMLDAMGFVTECTGDNIFIVKNGRISTPPYTSALRGVTRDTVMEIAAGMKNPVQERVITRHEVYNADEFFLTGTAAEIIPVVMLDGRAIGDGKPGHVTEELTRKYRELTSKDGVKY